MLLGEWNTAGNLEGWSGSSINGLVVANGTISGTGSAASPYIQKTAISNGPDLDLGFFDYLQIRLQVPASFNDDILFSFGTAVNPGLASNRVFRLSAAQVAKDGNWHTYRLDLGLVVWWRDTLRDLKSSRWATTVQASTSPSIMSKSATCPAIYCSKTAP